MDNQQVISLAWLAGFVNGDGCINVSRRRRSGGRVNYKPHIMFSNSDPELLEAISEILKTSGVGHYVTWKKNSGTFKTKNPLPVGNITVHGFLRCKKLLELLTPHLRGSKRKQAELAGEWISYRLTHGGPGKHHSYTGYDDAVYEKMAALKRELTPETTRAEYQKVL